MKNLTWPAVALVAVLGGLYVALVTVAGLPSAVALGVVGVRAGIGGGAALAQASNGGVQTTVEAIHSETQNQTAVLETVERRTNGELDARIEAGMERAADKAVAEVIGALRREGVLPRG